MLLPDNNQFLRETFQLNATLLLNCNENYAFMKSSVDELYRVASYLTGVTIDQITHDKDMMLPSGKAISTAAAAHCMLEMKRTAVFLRGIHKAITTKLNRIKKRPVRILYVGPGPYGTLLTPLLHLFGTDNILVDFIEINPDSLAALRKLTDALNLTCYIDNIYCADATTFTLTKPYEIVVSETMLACLRTEPQVAIMQNLIPQLKKGCIFIPEEISIDATLTNPKMEMERLMYYEKEPPPFERYSLGNIFRLGKLTIHDALERKTLLIPDEIACFPVLKLFTTVKVYQDEVLTGNDSSITLPRQYYDFRQQSAREVEFWYVQGEKPRIESRIVQHSLLSPAMHVY
jgi:phospholipid N-methyltransferase